MTDVCIIVQLTDTMICLLHDDSAASPEQIGREEAVTLCLASVVGKTFCHKHPARSDNEISVHVQTLSEDRNHQRIIELRDAQQKQSDVACKKKKRNYGSMCPATHCSQLLQGNKTSKDIINPYMNRLFPRGEAH